MTSRAKVPSSVLAAAVDSGAILERARVTGQNTALLDYVESGLRKKSRRRKVAIKSSAAAFVALIVLSWAIPYFRHTGSFETVAARRQEVTLADGSHAQLNARTEMKSDFRYGRRSVHLTQGEAFFSVVKDAAHPFLVKTPAGTVRVTGTEFNVRLDREGQAVVTLLEGSVELETSAANGRQSAAGGGGARVLAPGEQASIADADAGVRKLSRNEIEAAIAWRRGLILLDGLTVEEAASRVADFHGVTIRVSATAGTVRLGGSLPLDDLPKFFTTLKAIGGFRVIERGEGSYLIDQP